MENTTMKMMNLLFSLFWILLAGACSLSPTENSSLGKSYNIGDRGPGGGWVFFDKGVSSHGWQYLEAAPDDLGPTEWGCVGTSMPDAQQTGVGAGRSNSQAVVDSCRESPCAAHRAVTYRSGGEDDWFLPSRDELNAIYINLHKHGIGDFKNLYYWSSSEYSNTAAWYQSFGAGDQSYNDKDYPYGQVRPIRAF